MRSKATKPPAEQGGSAPDRALASVDDRSQPGETDEETALEQSLNRLAEAEREALAQARAEIAKRKEVEQKLGRLRIEAANLAIELNQAERDLEEARKAAKSKTAERIADLDAALVQARSELAREKASREQLGRDYDAAALQSGVQLNQLRVDAEQARAEADRARTLAEEAAAELKKAQAARAAREKELGDLRTANEQKLADLRGAHEKALAELRKAHEQELAAVQEALAREETGRNRDQEAATKQKAEQPQPLADESARAPIARPGRLKRRKRMFETRGRTCAVCRRTEAASSGALKAGGWALGAEIDLCPDCQEKGWQLPKAGSLPFRHSSHRNEVG